MIGWGNATGSICSMIFATVTGYLAVLNWHNAFYLYAIYILLLIAQVIILPKVPPEKQDVNVPQAKEKTKLNWLAYTYVLATFVYMVISMVYIVRVSVFIAQENIGNSAQAGMASSVVSVSALIITLIFAQIYKAFQRYTFFIGFASTALCFILLGISKTFSTIAVASVFMGISLGLVLPYLMTNITKVLPKGARTTGVSFISTSMYIGQFLAAYFVALLESMTGSTRASFTASGVILVIIAVISIVFILATKKQFNTLYIADDAVEN